MTKITDKKMVSEDNHLGKIPFAHDALFKKSLCHTAIAKDFFQHNLPAHVLEAIDLDTLALEPSSFIMPEGKSHFKDIVYRVTIKGKPGQLFCLAEHQSKADPWMPLRIQAYLMHFFLQRVEQGAKQLPPVLCCLFYHGARSPYPYSCDFLTLFEDQDWAKSHLFSPFHLIDLTQKSDDELLNHGKAAILEMLQKHIRARDIRLALEKLKSSGCFELDVEFGDYLKFVVKYVFQEGDAPDKSAIIQCLSEALPGQEKQIMSIAQQFIQEGMQQGMQKGMQQGMQKGMQKVAKNLLLRGDSKTAVKDVTGLSDSDLDDLLT